MKSRTAIYGAILIGGWAFQVVHAADAEVNDVSSEVETLTADSEAMVALQKAADERVAQEREENQKTIAAAKDARTKAIEQKRQARLLLRRDNAELQKLHKEQERLKGEMAELDQAAHEREKSIQDSHSTLAAQLHEADALRQAVESKRQHAEELQAEREKLIQEREFVEQALVAAQEKFAQSKSREQLAVTRLAQSQREETARQQQLKLQIAALKEQQRASSQRTASLNREVEILQQQSLKLETEKSVGEVELATTTHREVQAASSHQQAEQHQRSLQSQVSVPQTITVARAKSVVPSSVTLRKDCNVHDGPSRAARVVTIKLGGTAVNPVNSTVDLHSAPAWVPVALDDGEKGYVAKSCF